MDRVQNWETIWGGGGYYCSGEELFKVLSQLLVVHGMLIPDNQARGLCSGIFAGCLWPPRPGQMAFQVSINENGAWRWRRCEMGCSNYPNPYLRMSSFIRFDNPRAGSALKIAS
jgi:hypothetical protein